MTSATIDYAAIKNNQRAGWETGDYPRVGNTLQIIAEQLVEAADVRAGQRVLDVACGQGNAALAAARRFADATGVDYATNLLDQGRERAAAEHLPVTLPEGDAEALPMPDASFDLVAEHGRGDVRPRPPAGRRRAGPGHHTGGKIALASLDADRHGRADVQDRRSAGRRRRPGCDRAMLWGTPEHLAELFGDRVEWTSLTTREFVFRYHSPEHFSQWFREYYGPDHPAGRHPVGVGPGAVRRGTGRRRPPVQPGRRRHVRRRVGVPGGGRRTPLTPTQFRPRSAATAGELLPRNIPEAPTTWQLRRIHRQARRR